MSSSARNAVIAVAVAAVVAVAAAPFVIRGIKKQPAAPADVPATSESYQQEAYTYPEAVQEETTEDVLADIIESMDSQQTAQSVAAQAAIQQTPSNYTPQSSAQNAAPGSTTPVTTPKTTASSTGTSTTHGSIFNRVTTTKPAKTTTTTTTAATTKASTPAKTNEKDPITSVSGQEALSQGGVVSYLWNPEGNFYYVEDNPWQRNFGFNVIYDWAAATMVMYYDTWRAYFDYDGLEWMIQAWKGQYGFLFIGGEIGVYNRTPGSLVATSTHYNCADDDHLINMEMSIYYDARDGKGYQKLFTRAYYPHWWSTGFVDGHLAEYKFNDRSCLVQTARLTMYDEEMLAGFTAALDKIGFTRMDSVSQVTVGNSDTYAVSGLDVYYSWKTIDQGYKTR